MAKRQRLTPKLIESRERSVKAVELRLSGLSFRDIAEALEMSLGAVHKAVDRRMREVAGEPAEKLLHEERARLDRMQEAVWTGAASGDVKKIDAVLRIMERRAKLLGLDKPSKQEVSGSLNVNGPVIYVPEPDPASE